MQALTTSYLDFEVEIRKNPDRERPEKYRIRIQHSPYGGTPYEYFEEPFDAQELATFYHQTNLRTGLSDEKPVHEFGRQLFDTVFVNEVRDNFVHSLHRVKSKKRGLRICLRLDSVPELADLPWEYLHYGDNFLLFDRVVSLVRYSDLSNRPEVLPVESSLNILIAIASPTGSDRLNVKQERKLIENALENLVQQGVVNLDWLEPVTMEKLDEKLQTGTYHILHFIGHGGFDKHHGEGCLLFEDRNGGMQIISGRNLSVPLRDHHSLRLCVLNSCSTGRGSPNEFSSVAQRLINGGIPAVIAMQFDVRDDTAITFTEGFYRILAEKYHVDAALIEARHLIQNRQGASQRNLHDWGAPVLYMRVQNGNLFAGAKIPPPLGPAIPPPISRRRFISTAIGTSVGMTLGWFTRGRWPHVKWTMENYFSENTPQGLILPKAPRRIKDIVERVTGGKFSIDITSTKYSKMINRANVILANIGQDSPPDCAYNGVYYDEDKSALLFNCAIPFGLTSQEQNAWLYYKKNDSDEFTFMQDIYINDLDLNVIPFPAGSTGPQMGGWFHHEINSIEDLKKLERMRIPGLGAEVLERLDVTTDKNDPISISELADWLRAKDTRSAEWTGPYDDLQLGLHKSGARYYYTPGWWEPGTTFEMQVNKDRWDELPEEYQEVFKLACIETHMYTLAEYDQKNSVAWAEIKNTKPDIEIRRFNQDTLEKAKKATEDVLLDYASSDPIFSKVYKEWSEFRKRIRVWSELNNPSLYLAKFVENGKRLDNEYRIEYP